MKTTWFAILGLLLATGQTSWAAETDWQWVRVDHAGTAEGWEVLQGTTDVKIAGRKLTATLIYERPGLAYGFDLSGTISGNKVVVTEVRRESDVDPIRYQGTIEKGDPKTGDAMIVLRNGSMFLGLYRPPSQSR